MKGGAYEKREKREREREREREIVDLKEKPKCLLHHLASQS